MTRQRQILVTVTYNDLGCIIDTKAEPYEEPNLQPTCNQLATVAKDICVPCKDSISRQAAIAVADYTDCTGLAFEDVKKVTDEVVKGLKQLPSTQPETAKRIVGKSRDGMTMWYQCDMCNEPVDEKDTFCSGCGRRFVNG